MEHLFSGRIKVAPDQQNLDEYDFGSEYTDYYEEGSEDVEEDFEDVEEDSGIESDNDIRFADFEDDEWIDNAYIWALCQYLDDFTAGKIKDESLEPYRETVKGKFAIRQVEPALLGGLFIMFTFIDQPEDIFSTWVHSDVNVTTREVSNYTVHDIKLEDFKNEMSREEILKVVEESPRVKLF